MNDWRGLFQRGIAIAKGAPQAKTKFSIEQ
jgi:hypothetical protein